MKTNATTPKQRLSPVKRAYLALQEMQAKCESLEQASTEPIAIVGLACRFPGGADDWQAYWRLLASGRDAIGEAPAGRWNSEAFDDPNPQFSGKVAARLGGFLEGPIDRFDPHFFGIAPREAQCLDPQQRLLLEVSWEALEHGGQIEDRLAPSRTGVFVGITSHDYSQVLSEADNFDQLDTYFITGSSLNAAAGRLSYTLGFQGPSMAIDTACSSSLVAIHQACRSLLCGECDRALAGGVNLILSPLATVALSRGSVLATDGRCKAFDAAADGMVRGEGCAVIVLKRLSDALDQRDNVMAVIRGSAVNQDGASSGLTVPNGPAQEAVIRQALTAARLAHEDIDYIEAHGTGTSLGDPIEAHALSNVFDHLRNRPLVVASAKTNIGHLEAASGIAGVVKVVLALMHQQIPPHLHFRNPSPHIRWENSSLLIPTELQPWPSRQRPRFAGVSSFGFSGTNAHLIVGDIPLGHASFGDDVAPTSGRNQSATVDRPLHVLALSAKTNHALVELAGRYEQHFAGSPSDELPDMCFTANAGRGHWRHRLALVGASVVELRKQLAQFVTAGDGASSGKGRPASQLDAAHSGPPKLAMLYTGRAADTHHLRHWADELYRTQPTFRGMLDCCEELLATEFDLPLLAMLFGEQHELLDQPEYARPAMTAVQYALGQLWMSWGVRPSLVLGQGVGQYVGACFAGVLSLEDALLLSTKSAVGPAALADYARKISCRAPQASFIGLTATTGDAAIVTPEYWSQPRDTDAGLNGWDELQRRNCQLVLSIGADATSNRLFEPDAMPGLGHLSGAPAFGWQSLLETLAELYRCGADINWRGFDQVYRRRRVVLPTYPFQRERYWHETRSGTGPSARAAQAASSGHPLLGQRLKLAGSHELRFESQLSPDHPAFLQDHRVFGSVVFPAAALLGVALAAGAEALETNQLELKDVVIEQPLVLPENETITVQTVLVPRFSDPPRGDLTAGDECSFKIFSHVAATDVEVDEWICHTVGTVSRLGEVTEHPAVNVEAARAGEPTTTDALYDRCTQRGIEFGDSFRTLRHYWRNGHGVLGHVQLPDSLISDIDAYAFHPALLDGGLQVLAAMEQDGNGANDPHLPVAISRFRFFRSPGAEVWSHCQQPDWLADITTESRPESLTVNLKMVTTAGESVATIEGLQLKSATRESMLRISRAALKTWLYRVEWRLSDLNKPQPEIGSSIDSTLLAGQRWLVLSTAPQGGWAEKLACSLESRGAACTIVSAGDDYHSKRDGKVVLDPLRRDHFQHLLSEQATVAGPLRGVVLIGGSPDGAVSDAPSTTMEQSVLRDCAGLLHMVQAVVEAGLSRPPNFWTISCGAQAVLPCENLPGFAQAGLWGLTKTIPLEHPELDCRYVDLDPNEGEAQLDMLCAELLAADYEQHVAFRHGQRRVARIVPYRKSQSSLASEAVRFRADASYMITGGLRGLGLEVARWMAQRGVGRLVLVGRTAPDEKSRRWIDEIQRAGTTIDIVQADVSDAGQVAWLRDRLATGSPLCGVVHCAIVLDDGILMQQTAERFRGVLAPKVAGTWNLHELTRDMPLDFFLLFSSAASLMGSAAQGSYCAANAFLDSLAEYRRSLGLPGLSINWGPWSGTGTVARSRQDGVRDLAGGMRDRGIQLIRPRQGLQILEQLLADDPGQVAVVPGNWSQLAGRSFRETPSLLRDLVFTDASSPHDGAAGKLWAALNGSSREDRRSALVRFLRDNIARVLRWRPDQVEVNEPLNMLGLDSLMAVELRNRVNTQLHIDIPVVTFMEGQRILDLADEIDRRMLMEACADPATSDREQHGPLKRPIDVSELDSLKAQQLLARLDDLSDAEVEVLLNGHRDNTLDESTD